VIPHPTQVTEPFQVVSTKDRHTNLAVSSINNTVSIHYKNYSSRNISTL